MLTHVVCFKLADNSQAEKEKARDVLLSMKENVPMIRSIEVGTDVLGSPRSYDIILTVRLDDLAALDAYQKDQYHCSVVKEHMHSVAAASIAIDYYC